MKILKFSKNKNQIINEIREKILGGKIVVLPTDTVYGLVCDARNKRAVKKIFEIKKRPFDKPIGIFVKDIEMTKKIAQIDKEQKKLLKQKWPGKTTFILKKKCNEERPRSILVGTKETIGMRISKYELILALFEKIDFPLAQTSANISNEPATTKISEVIKYFENEKIQPDLVIDAGNLPESKPSTVIDLTSEESRILRK